VNLKYIPLILLVSLVASSIELDISVPGFPAMALYFNTSEATIQSTLSLNFLGFCISALFFGPLADSYGRKKILVGGFILFGICSLCCAITEHLSWLLTYRFFQGLGASCTWVVAYVIVADLYQGPQAVKFIGLMNAVVTAAMALAPAAGALLCDHWGWRSTYSVTAGFSIISLLLLTLFLPETNKQLRPLNMRLILRDYRTLLLDYNFMIYALAPSILSASYMAYIACASSLYIGSLHMSFNQYALHQTLVIGAFSLTSFKVDYLQNKFGELKIQYLALFFSILSMSIIVPLSKLYPTSATVITACMIPYAIGAAVCFSIVVAKTLDFYPDLKGTASSLMMAIRVAFCSFGVWIGAQVYTGELYDSAVVIAILAAFGIVSHILTLRHGAQLAQPTTGG
jgi:DHA1 family bicyclomycin/chloramphenicol resistance-like MFS transporter